MWRYLVVFASALLLASPLLAQTKHTRPIRLIVPYVPGGGSDTIGRLLAPYITDEFGQQVVIDNRGGANSTIGTNLIARAAPDGHTFGMIDSAFVINPAVQEKLPYDTLKDFTPIALVRAAPLVLLVHPSMPVQTLKDFIAYAKARPGKLTFGSAGTGSGQHLAGEQFHKAAALDIIHVPYKGSGQAMADLLGAQISLMYITQSVANPHIAGGKLRPLAISSAKRSRFNPDVITFAEAGFPSVNAVTINGIIAPAGMPRDVVQRLNAMVARILKSRELEKKLPDLEFDGEVFTPEQFGAWIRGEVEKWRKLLK
ncbi:MAG: tripartite tricarboxylate transporter substrate binding protein [Burkholderiales bacterium]